MDDQDKSKEQLIAELAALRESEQRCHTLVESIPHPVGHYDADGKLIECNCRWYEYTGQTVEEARGDGWLKAVHPDDVERIAQTVREVVSGGNNYQSEHRLRRISDGSYRWHLAQAMPRRDASGAIVGWFSSCIDIDDQKRAELALAERESRLLEAQEVANMGFYVLDIPRGHWTSSSVLDQIFDIPLDFPKTVDGWGSILHPDDRQVMLDYFFKEVVGSKKPFDREYRIVRHGDNRVRWVHGLGRLEFDKRGQPVSMLGTIQDITERKRAEEELAKSKVVLQAAIDCLPFNFFAIGLDGRYMLQNAVSKAQQRADVVGKLPEEACPNEHDLAIWKDNNRRAFAGEKVDGEVTLSLGGEERFYHNIIAPIRDGDEMYGILGVNIDITKRKRAEEALQKAHDELERRIKERTAELAKANEELALFHKFAETSSQGFGMSDLGSRIVYANPTMRRLMGEDKPENIIGKHPLAYYPEAFKEQRETEMLPALERDGRWEGEITIVSRQGKLTPTLHHVFLLRDNEGRPVRRCVVVTDITERKQAEEALRESEEKYRGVAEACPDAIILSDLTGRVLFASRQTWGLLGLADSDELTGRSIFDYVIGNDRKRLAGNLANLLEVGLRRSTEYTSLRKDGSTVPVEASSVVIRDATGQPKAVMAVLRDITERKKAEEALRASEERYELAVRGAGVGIWDWDIRTGKLYFSPRWKMLFGYCENDIGDSLEDWARLLHPDERDWILKFLDDFLAGTSSTVTVEYRLRHKDGSYRWIVAHGLVVRDERGKACRFVGSHGDITDRKQAEDALERERRTLKHLLQSSDHERQLIAYEIHDELAQQLAGAIMQFQTYDHLKETEPKQAANAYHAGMTMLRQSHFEARRLISGVRLPILDEAGVVAAISHLVNEQKQKKGPKIEYLSKVEFNRLVPILENAVYRITQEALTNACRYSKSKKIKVELVQDGDQLRIEVQDRGVGFKLEDVEEGQFGLAGIRARARLLGGKATIESEPGKGTRIGVELPIVLRNEEEDIK